MKKLILTTLAAVSVFSQFSHADVSTRVTEVISGTCESVDGKFSAMVDGTRTDQVTLGLFKTGFHADMLRVQMTQKATQEVSEHISVDGEVDRFVYYISEDGTRMNVNYIDYSENAHEVDMNCTTKIDADAMKDFTRQSVSSIPK